MRSAKHLVPAISVKPRVIQLGIVAVLAVVALSVAMCGTTHPTSSNAGKRSVTATAQPGPPPLAAPPPSPEANDYVEGLVQSLSGNTIQLRTRTGSATVDFNPATRVVDVTAAQLRDVTPGSCVNVRPAPQGAPTGAPITAQTVTITPTIDGKCPPPAGFYAIVASVSANAISVTGIRPGDQSTPTTVTVANTTSYQKQTPTDTNAIANGKCMGAQGRNDGGALQAMLISLQTCPPMGHPHHHLHLPHLPFHL